jgi:O-antigen/teichoic acid export membrane protein
MSAVAIGNILVVGTLSVRHYRRLPGRRHGMACGDGSAGEIRRDLRRLNKPILLRRICGRIGLLSDCLIVSALLGPSLVVPLFVTQRLAALVQAQLQAIGSASWAALAALYAQGQLPTFNRRLVELTNLVAVLGVTVLVPIIAYNHHFIGLWVGGQHYGGDFLTAVAACNAFLLSLTTLWDWCFGGTGQVARLVPLSLISTTVNVTLTIVFTQQVGPVGPLLGTLAALATCSIWYLPYLLRQVFQTSPRELIKAVAGPLAWGLPYGGFLWWFARSHKPWGWIGLATEMGFAALLFLASWWLVGFARSERALWVQRLRTVFRCAA